MTNVLFSKLFNLQKLTVSGFSMLNRTSKLKERTKRSKKNFFFSLAQDGAGNEMFFT